MPEIAGKEVKFRDRFPAAEYWDLPKLIIDAGVEGWDYQRQIPLLARIIVSWEFEGDPSDPESYAGLDILRELRPLIRACSDYVSEMISGEAA